MSSTNERTVLGLFFTGDKNDNRGLTFYNRCSTSPDSPACQSLAVASSYSNKQSGMNDNDLHNEFVDFVVETALWHKRIDIPIGESAVTQNIRDAVRNHMKILGDNTSTDLKRFNGTGAVKEDPADQFHYWGSPSGGHDDVLGMNSRGVFPFNKQTRRPVDYYEHKYGTKFTGVVCWLEALLTYLVYNVRTYLLKNKPLAVTDSDYLKNVDNPDKGVRYVGETIAKMLYGSTVEIGGQFELVGEKKHPKEYILESFKNSGISASLAEAYSNTILAELQKELTNIVEGYARGVFAHYNQNKNSLVDTVDPTTGDLNALYSFDPEVALVQSRFPLFVKHIEDHAANTIIRFYKQYAQSASYKHPTLADSRVYELYRSLNEYVTSRKDDNVAKYLEENITLMENKNGSWTNVGLKTSVSSNKDSYRLNLLKSPVGSRDIRVSTLLPVFQQSYSSGIWYTSAKDKRVVEASTRKVFPDKFLKELYMKVYGHQGSGQYFTAQFPPIMSTSELYLPTEYKGVSSKYFGVDDNKLIQALLNRDITAVQNVKAGTVPYDVNDFYVGIYSVDEKGDILRNGVKFNISETMLQNNCLGTHLMPSNGPECTSYVSECLNNVNGLSGDDRLTKCVGYLSKIKHFNMDINQATTEFHPSIVLNTIKALNFRAMPRTKQINGRVVDYLECQSVSGWLSELRNSGNSDKKAVADQVEGNNALYAYLSSMVAYINANPGLLDKNKGKALSKPLPLDDPPYSKVYNTRLYRKPDILQKMYSLGHYLHRVVYPMQLIASQRGGSRVRIPSMNKFVPISRMSQHGGDPEKYKTGSNTLRKLYDRLTNELKSKGKTISGNSVQKIQSLLEKYEQAESNLSNSLMQLEKYLWLVDTVGDNNKREGLDLETVSSMVKTHEGLLYEFKKNENKIYNVMFGLMKVIKDDGSSSPYKDAIRNRTISDQAPSSVPLF